MLSSPPLSPVLPPLPSLSSRARSGHRQIIRRTRRNVGGEDIERILFICLFPTGRQAFAYGIVGDVIYLYCLYYVHLLFTVL